MANIEISSSSRTSHTYSTISVEPIIRSTPNRKYLRSLSESELSRALSSYNRAIDKLLQHMLAYYEEACLRARKQGAGRVSNGRPLTFTGWRGRVVKARRDKNITRFSDSDLRAYIRKMDSAIDVIAEDGKAYFEEAKRRITRQRKYGQSEK